LVNRLAFNVKLPLTDVVPARTGELRRGDIVTFYCPVDSTRLIKRVLALPGDVVAMRNEKLIINGEAASYAEAGEVMESLGHGRFAIAQRFNETIGARRQQIQVLPSVVARRNFGPLTVPKDQFLMLGDNRYRAANAAAKSSARRRNGNCQ